jgi:hypothetical protein
LTPAGVTATAGRGTQSDNERINIMEFRAYTKSVKADFAKREITLTFTVSMDEENMETATELAPYASEDGGAVELKILPYQRSFLNKAEVVLTHQ